MNAFRSVLGTALVLAGGTALAQDNTDGLYVGAGFGDFSAQIDEIDDVDDAIADFDEDEGASKYSSAGASTGFSACKPIYTISEAPRPRSEGSRFPRTPKPTVHRRPVAGRVHRAVRARRLHLLRPRGDDA